MKIRDQKSTQTPDEMAQSWAAMSLEIFTQTVAEASREMNVVALQAMLDGGAFDLDDLDRHVQDDGSLKSRMPPRDDGPNAAPRMPRTNKNRDVVKMDLWGKRVAAFCAFARNADFAAEPTNLPGTWSTEYSVSVLRTSDLFRAWFVDATPAVVSNYLGAMRSKAADEESKEELRRPMAMWMSCACMLDMPGVVSQVHKACDKAATRLFPVDFFSAEIARRSTVEGIELWLSPIAAALEFSSTKCLDFFDKALPDGLHFERAIGSKHDRRIADKAQAMKSLMVEDVLTGSSFTFHCDNATFARVARLAMASDKHRPRVIIASGQAIAQNDHRVAAYLAAGIYQASATPSAKQACVHGLPTVVEALAPLVRWEQVDPTTVRDAAQAHVWEGGRRMGLREDAIVKFVRGAHAHGDAEAVKNVFGMGTFKLILQKNMERTLVALLDVGAVQPHAADFGDDTAMQEARAAGSPLADVMASWLARRTAHALLDGMGLDSFRAWSTAKNLKASDGQRR